MSRLTTEQWATLRRMIDQFEHGIPDYSVNDYGIEWFGPRQKPLTYKELHEIRSLLIEDAQRKAVAKATAKVGVDTIARVAKIAMDGLGETLLPPIGATAAVDATDAAKYPATVQLLSDAADALSAVRIGYSLDASRDWKLLIGQLYDRAAQLRWAAERRDVVKPIRYRLPRTGEEVEALCGNPKWAHLLKDMQWKGGMNP